MKDNIVKRKRQYVEIERLDWDVVKDYFILYIPLVIINLVLGIYFILISWIPFLNIRAFGRFMEGEYEGIDFYKKIKLEVKS